METIETIKYKGYTINIHPDPDPVDPTENDEGWLGMLVHWHRRYRFCNRSIRVQDGGELDDIMRDAFCYIPVGLLDHSGLHLYEGGKPHWSDSAGWDSGHVGFLVASKKDVECFYGNDVNEDTIRNALRHELKILDAWISGGTCGYTIEELNDDCWGFYGKDEAVKMAMDSIDYQVNKEYESRDMHAPCVIGGMK